MDKAIVIGCPGSGKSTFSRALRDRTKLPLYYLDRIWHKPDRTNVSTEEFDRSLEEIVHKDRWIIDGNYARTLEFRMKLCDTVFLFDYPTDICFKGVASRIGCIREDMPWVETEFDSVFRQWICDFPAIVLPKIYALIREYAADRQIIVFNTREAVADYLAHIDG